MKKPIFILSCVVIFCFGMDSPRYTVQRNLFARLPKEMRGKYKVTISFHHKYGERRYELARKKGLPNTLPEFLMISYACKTGRVMSCYVEDEKSGRFLTDEELQQNVWFKIKSEN